MAGASVVPARRASANCPSTTSAASAAPPGATWSPAPDSPWVWAPNCPRRRERTPSPCPGTGTTAVHRPPEVIAALEPAYRRGARIASLCTGAFTLAAAGLLNGRTVTTHWASAGDLEDLHPHVSVDRNVLYIDDCQIPTSAGVTAGIDLCLYLVHKDVGAAVANEIARELVVAPRRRPGPVHPPVAARAHRAHPLGHPRLGPAAS
ncbi:GlxA family transcriptional regulator [Streptomyces griseofuscus]|uniref:GlxA family transcriptional regulator n=1 Tax=Streptomyces griseofuscus TaxID=146922 RepID=UPI0038217435